ncbi:uncharacterized protein LOC121881599 [Scomber scombrus]|uniref:Uncharacterized protein LOC121881599 n=1 Tax=Scomber scombrus TaxID=13677 RepID=A0AAV1P8S6_SCOSC
MLNKATSGINCTNYHVIVRGLSKAFPAIPVPRRQGITKVLLDYLRTSVSVINKPGCRQGIESDAQWLEANCGPFSQYATYSDLKLFNISGVAVVESLSAQQKAELILDPDSGALEDEATIKEVFKSLTESPDNEQLVQFFQAFTNINKQRNITIITNPGVRDIIFNLTLTALAPEFKDFQPVDFELWFQVNLAPVMASIHPGILVVIPRDISCASYAAILTGLRQSLKSLPPHISQGVRSSVEALQETFKRCSVPDSFRCKDSHVNEDLICGAVESSQLEQTLANDNSSEALCNFTIKEHACSSAKHLTSSNLVALMNCSLESQTTYPVEVWKLFFQKASIALDQALTSFASTAPNKSSPSLSHALEALGELRIANFSQAQLQNDAFVSSWFQTNLRPFLASPSNNFLFCLSSKDFSCQTYHTVIKAFGSQRASMDREGQQAVFTHFIKPFLSRNDSSDPGCVSFTKGSKAWLQANLGSFSGFATLQDLQALNPNFSSVETLSVLTPTQVAQLTLSSVASNETDQIDLVFERLEEGNALENVDEFLTELTANGTVPDFQPVVRDRIMNRTFVIISVYFTNFKEVDWFDWFHLKLISVLPSFTPVMLNKATSGINCTNYHVIVRGLSKAFPAIPVPRRQGITKVLLDYLRTSVSVINKPGCRQGIESDAQWLEANCGPFSQYATYSDLKLFNISGVAVVESLSAQQKAELILDPDSGALEDEATIKEVFKSLTESPDNEQLVQFFQAFTNINKQRNITIITNPGVRDIIFNLTLTALAPEFKDFQPVDFELWFQVNLAPVMASIHPGILVVIPRDISCASYAAILTGLRQSLKSLPPHISQGVRSSVEALQETFKRCSVPDSFRCKDSHVNEDLICGAVESSQLEQTLANDNSSEALCNFTIKEHACSSAKDLTSSNLVALMNCSLESQTTYPVEVWKLFFQKASIALDQALTSFASTAPNKSSPSLSHALEALGELRIANFSQAQLQNDAFVSSWFQTNLRPFLASPSNNFLFCLSSKDFSCQTYHTVIKAFGSQRASMDREGQQAVFTHFIKPFLSRNDSSDPGCVSFTKGSKAWLQANLGSFSGFATLQDLQALNPNFSSVETLSVLTPTQVAQLTLSSVASNETDQIDLVFERLEEGNALDNVDEFLTELTANGTVPDFQPVVRDRIMNRTFVIISVYFTNFKEVDWFDWFHLKLISVLPSFTPVMLNKATSGINCTNYHVIVRGLSKAFPAIPVPRRQGITKVLLDYLRTSVSVINKPGCRQGIESDAQWLEANCGPFSQYATYSDLKLFNISGVAVVESLSAQQKAELILDPDSGALEDEATIKEVFKSLTESPDNEQLVQFFQAFTNINKQRNITIITNPGVRDIIFNLTLTALAPEFKDFQPVDFELWFQVNLAPVMASIHPGILVVIPRDISCASYAAILTGLRQSLKSLPPHISQGVRSSVEALQETFKRCSVPDSFRCKDSHVNEDLICGAVESSQLEQTLANDNSSEALCNFTIKEHACSSAKHLTSSNLVALMNCSLESQTTYPVEVWKLFFQKASIALDQALTSFASTAPNKSSPSLSHALEALGELRIANFSQAQLQNDAFVSSWFQTNLRPFLASPSNNFLFCLSSKDFSCQTYHTVIKAFGSQRASMDREGQQAVFTHFIKPFLSRNDSSDPGCVSFTKGSKAWLQANLGSFSGFATLQDLQALNPNFSSVETLSVLTPTQVAQLTLSSVASNETDQIDLVFERLEEGNALENVDEFLTELTANGTVPDFQPVVRDRIMNRTFVIISVYFTNFKEVDWFDWFHLKLISVLPSFTPVMLNKATSGINCTNYHVIVRGLSKAFPAIPVPRRQGITKVLLDYLRTSVSVINKPGCRQGIESDAQWLEANCGPFSQYATYSDLKLFNISGVTVLNSLSSSQQAEFLLEPNNLSNETLVRLVFTGTSISSSMEDLGSFFEKFVSGAAEQNLTNIDPKVRDTILNLTLMALSPNLYMLDAGGFKLWFQVYLPLFLTSIDSSTFEIIPRNITCNSFQEIVVGCDNVFPHLSKRQTQQVFTFTRDYLRRHSSSGFSCVESVNDDRRWLEDNFGRFRVQASFIDFMTLKENFNGVHVADLLTPIQLAQLAATPSQLKRMEDVTKIMAVINPVDYGAFFDIVSPAIEIYPTNYTVEVKSAFLQAVFDRSDLSSPAVSDIEFLHWLRVRLRPLLINLSPDLVTPLYDIGNNRSCNSSQEMIALLDTLHQTLNSNTQREIYKSTFLFLQGPTPLKCYGGGSFYSYLRNTFLSFGFPDLSMFTSLLPQKRKAELLSTITTSELRQFLSQPSVIGNDSDICVIFNNYNNTPAFLETEDVPDDVKMVTLPCVWPLALRSNSRSEVDSWFNLRLRNYLRFLSKSLINSTAVQNASCLAFQKLISVLGNNFTYNSSDFGRDDVYTTIRTYLRAGSGARCYNASDAELNSTAWFANYIGSFVTFITLDDITTFMSTSQIQVFLEDQDNLELFNNTAIPENVTNYYISQLFTSNPTFSPLKLPGFFLCSSEIPSLVYSSLNEADSIHILNELKTFCNGTQDPEVSAALASNFQTVTAQTFGTLESASSGLTSSQISSVSPSVLISSLSILSSVSTWSQEQATTIIQVITSSGFKINSGSSLESLGTLVAGIPSKSIESIQASELLKISQSTTFVSNMLVAPTVVQETYVQKIISVDQSPASVLVNVPDAMAVNIPPSLLVFSEEAVNIRVINRKKWRRHQAAMFFGVLGNTDFDIEQLSPSVLQGFTCTSIQRMTRKRIRRLIRSSRPRRGRAKVELKESQLTCMYNLLNGDYSQTFTDYPADMLLYFNNRDVKRANCRSYFSAVGAADFSVASSILNKNSVLFGEARDCLGISDVSLSRDNIEVLGNMACTLDSSYIQNSDPLILEKLKACKSFSDNQVAAMETLLLSGKTSYGEASTWNKKTLENLGILPLYFTRNIWGQFKTSTKRRFLKSFMSQLRKRKTKKRKLKALFKQISSLKIKRGAGCTVGNITQVTVNDASFPFGYDQTQFDLCLDVSVLKDNLNAICEKVDDDDFQKIILKKLNQAFPSGVSDSDVQVLGSVSRVASLDDISKWTITTVDTLAALMKAEDGQWEAAKSKAIITKYLNTSGNSLGSNELNSIDSNLCSLDNSTLKTITPDSIRNANPLNVASCSSEQKRILYEISNTSFSSHRDNSSSFYNLVQPSIGGAPLSDVVVLSSQNISMDVDAFRSLDPDVIAGLSVTNVNGLMGNHLQDLKLFENDTVIQTWVNLQLQSDLDRLGVGLTTNRASPTTAPTTAPPSSSSSTTAAASPASSTTVTTTTKRHTSNSIVNVATTGTTSQSQAATTSGGSELAKHPIFIILAALLTSVKILQQPA